MHFVRYGIYYTPPSGAFSDAGASWLGWDIAAGVPTFSPASDLTMRPRKYGFHGTIKPPFRLADGKTFDDLTQKTAAFCESRPLVSLQSLEVSLLGRFLALTPRGETTSLSKLAAAVVSEFDAFRAPPTQAERARRVRPGMPAPLKNNFERWGYPYVMDAFRFHITLTGPLDRGQTEGAHARAIAHFSASLPDPFVIGSLTLAGEDTDGMFHAVRRFELKGQ